MKAKKIWANFKVKDVGRTRTFYSALGFKPNGSNDHPQLASFIFGESDFIIHFFEHGSQIDKYLPDSKGTGEIIFTFSADSEAEIAQFAAKVKDAGGTVFQEAGRDENNYYGCGFTDPDGHRFNLLLMEKGM